MRTDKFHTHFRTNSRIEDRTFEFATATIRFVQQFGEDMPDIIAKKIVTLGAEIGHEVAEAHIGNNPKRFHRRMTDARRMSREIAYWLKLAEAADLAPQDVVVRFLEEAEVIHRAVVKACKASKAESDENDSD